MQGWGQLFNQGILIILLVIFHGSGNPPYSRTSAQYTYRISFVFILLVTLWLLYYRVYRSSRESVDGVIKKAKRDGSVTGCKLFFCVDHLEVVRVGAISLSADIDVSIDDTKSLRLALSHFGGRLLATAGTWFVSE